MKYSTASVWAASVWPVTTARLTQRYRNIVDSADAQSVNVCFPSSDDSGPIAPCAAVINIETACQANGTDKLDYKAHAQCMCNGSFFADWNGCQQCLLVHGLRSERDNAYYMKVIEVASESLCQGNPTAEFSSYFAAAETNTVAAPFVTTGNTVNLDRFPGETAVDIYYKPTITQGPGSISCSESTSSQGPPHYSKLQASATTCSEEGAHQTENSAVHHATTTVSDHDTGAHHGGSSHSASKHSAPQHTALTHTVSQEKNAHHTTTDHKSDQTTSSHHILPHFTGVPDVSSTTTASAHLQSICLAFAVAIVLGLMM